MVISYYKPVSQMTVLEHQIITLTKRQQRINQKINDPDYNKKRALTKKLRDQKKRREDPVWHEKQKQESRDYRKANPEKAVQYSTKWNKTHRKQRNETIRKRYAEIKNASL